MTDKPNPLDIDEIADELKRATPGEWEVTEADSLRYTSVITFPYLNPEHRGTIAMVGQSDIIVGASMLSTQNANARLIALLRNNADDLLSLARIGLEAREALAKAEEWFREYEAYHQAKAAIQRREDDELAYIAKAERNRQRADYFASVLRSLKETSQ